MVGDEIMFFMPELELGFWNAWILVVPMLIVLFSDMRATAARELGKEGDFQLSKKENMLMNTIFLPMVVSWLYSVFLPLQLGTAWLYSGLVIFLFGIVVSIAAILNFATSTKDRVITRGLYRFTRNPIYIGMILMHIGVGIACSSWLLLLLTVVLMILLNAVLPSEERYCLYRFGDEYRKYKNRTPRWLEIPKPSKTEDWTH